MKVVRGWESVTSSCVSTPDSASINQNIYMSQLTAVEIEALSGSADTGQLKTVAPTFFEYTLDRF